LDGVRERIDDERCIYIHDVVGAHTANPASGDFSVEISNPIWMENGEYGRPIRKAMLAGNVFSLLTALSGIGEGSRVVGSSIMPPVRLHNQRIIGG
ncbi:MAG: metallopeptidase TldD-related protein, partial [Methanomicrobiales archaeon]|nr:metallopeptidase TldD-related protein [Methanomicrobiales archaeon]